MHSVDIVEIYSRPFFRKKFLQKNFVKLTHLSLNSTISCFHETFFKWEKISHFPHTEIYSHTFLEKFRENNVTYKEITK